MYIYTMLSDNPDIVILLDNKQHGYLWQNSYLELYPRIRFHYRVLNQWWHMTGIEIVCKHTAITPFNLII